MQSDLEVIYFGKGRGEKFNKPQNVTHLWFTGWPDFGIPEGEDDIASFGQMASILADFVCDDEQQGRPLIHCRAGWGRSGTLTTITS